MKKKIVKQQNIHQRIKRQKEAQPNIYSIDLNSQILKQIIY